MAKLNKRGTISLIESKHEPYCLTEDLSIPLLKTLNSGFYEFFSIIFSCLLIKACYIFHRGQLVEHEADRENVALEYVVLGKPRISINNMCFPEYGRKVLRGSSDGSSGWITSILALSKVVLTFTKVNNLNFSSRHLK